MTTYLLDTNVCIRALKDDRGILQRLLAEPPSSIRVSVESFLRPLTVLDFTPFDARMYAQVRAELEKSW